MYNDTGHNLVVATLTTNTAIGRSRPLFAFRRLTCCAELVRQAEDRLELLVERPAKYPATKFPVWSFPAIVYYDGHDSMKSTPIEIVVLPSPGITVTTSHGSLYPDWCLYHAYSGIKYYLYMTQQADPADMRRALPTVVKDTFRGGTMDEKTWRALEWTAILRAATLVSGKTFALDEITRGIRHTF